MRRLRMVVPVLAMAVALTAVPATPASATHNCGELDVVCSLQHYVLDKLNFLIECKILHNC